MASAGSARPYRYRTADPADDGIATGISTDISTTRTLAHAVLSDASHSDRGGDAPVVAATQRQLAAPVVP